MLDAATVTTPRMKSPQTTLSQLYRQKIAFARKLLVLEAKATGPLIRDRYHVLALEAENDASGVAHCIAAYGDMTCERFLVDFKRRAIRLKGVYGGSWRRGVAAVERVGDA